MVYVTINTKAYYLDKSCQHFIVGAFLAGFRLDLDACKNRLRKARSMQGQQSVSTLILFLIQCCTCRVFSLCFG